MTLFVEFELPMIEVENSKPKLKQAWLKPVLSCMTIALTETGNLCLVEVDAGTGPLS